MKNLLIKMASIANELDLNGFEKEANQVTEAMVKMAQAQTPSGVSQRGVQYNANQESDFKKILDNPAFKNLPEDILYNVAKGLFTKDIEATNFANNFMAYKRQPWMKSSPDTAQNKSNPGLPMGSLPTGTESLVNPPR
jgi:hypothetical protein